MGKQGCSKQKRGFASKIVERNQKERKRAGLGQFCSPGSVQEKIKPVVRV